MSASTRTGPLACRSGRESSAHDDLTVGADAALKPTEHIYVGHIHICRLYARLAQPSVHLTRTRPHLTHMSVTRWAASRPADRDLIPAAVLRRAVGGVPLKAWTHQLG